MYSGIARVFFESLFVVCYVAKRCICAAKVSEGTNRNMSARNTLVQLLALYTNPESLRMHSVRQMDRHTNDRIMPIADHTV